MDLTGALLCHGPQFYTEYQLTRELIATVWPKSGVTPYKIRLDQSTSLKLSSFLALGQEA